MGKNRVDLKNDLVVVNTYRRNIDFGVNISGTYDVTLLENDLGEKYFHVLLIGSGLGVQNFTEEDKRKFESAIGDNVRCAIFTG